MRKKIDIAELIIGIVITIILITTTYVSWKSENHQPEEREKVLRNEFGQRLD